MSEEKRGEKMKKYYKNLLKNWWIVLLLIVFGIPLLILWYIGYLLQSPWNLFEKVIDRIVEIEQRSKECEKKKEVSGK